MSGFHLLTAVIFQNACDKVLLIKVLGILFEMHANVRSHAAQSIAAIATDRTAERFDAGMRLEMTPQFGRCAGDAVAHWAFVLVLGGMLLLLLLLLVVGRRNVDG